MRLVPLIACLICLSREQEEAGNISVRDRSNETHAAELDVSLLLSVVKENAERWLIRFQTVLFAGGSTADAMPGNEQHCRS